MATSPDCGIASAYLQGWQMPNVFVHGGSPFPNQGPANPMPPIRAFTHRTADTDRGSVPKEAGMLS
jgi:gluconate 2-dehydrogenase alpha chain